MADTYNQKTDRQDTAGSFIKGKFLKLAFQIYSGIFCIDGSIFDCYGFEYQYRKCTYLLARDPENTGKTGRGRNGSKYYMEDTSATGSDGSNPWGSVVIIWILTSDFLFQSDRGTVCPWNFVRSEDDGGTGNDILFGTPMHLCLLIH